MAPNRDPVGDQELHGVSVPLEVVPSAPHTISPRDDAAPTASDKVYSPERQRDAVRLVVTCGLLFILGYLVVFATIESASYPAHWGQAKEMLQILLPALTGLIGTVIGFYFGTTAANRGNPPGA